MIVCLKVHRGLPPAELSPPQRQHEQRRASPSLRRPRRRHLHRSQHSKVL